jgi:hypothetical protein
MIVGGLVGVLGAFVLLVAHSTAGIAAGIALTALGGTVVFVSGVAAGVANGLARHEHLRSRR